MHAYLYKGDLCNSNVTVTKETIVTATLLLQRYPLYKYACILVQRIPLYVEINQSRRAQGQLKGGSGGAAAPPEKCKKYSRPKLSNCLNGQAINRNGWATINQHQKHTKKVHCRGVEMWGLRYGNKGSHGMMDIFPRNHSLMLLWKLPQSVCSCLICTIYTI